MATEHSRKIGQGPKKETVTRMDTSRDTWRVMKPFVHFSVKAMQVIASGLIFIVKHIPKPHDEGDKDDKVIKVK